MGKKIVGILAGLAIIAISLKMFVLDVWLVVGLYLLLKGILPFFCTCECCGACKKK